MRVVQCRQIQQILRLITLAIALAICHEFALGQTDVQSDTTKKQVETAEQTGIPIVTQMDRVVVRQAITGATRTSLWNPLRESRLEGHIKQLDADGLVIESRQRASDESTAMIRVPSEQLQYILPAWKSDETADIVQLFEQQKFREFIQALRELDVATIPRWQQLLLLSRLVRSIDALQGAVGSGQHFLTMAESSPVILFADMPLCWTSMEPDASLQQKAEAWLVSENPTAQLLGASWLIHGANPQPARQTILRLKSEGTPGVSQLATAQAWRLITPNETMQEIRGWIAYRDRMLPALAIGPTEFMADRLARIGQSDLALGQLLWIASQHGDRHNRAVKALSSAVDLMKRDQRDAEAERIAEWLNQLHGQSE